LPEAEKRELRAEARVGRAWMHFILAQIFCKPYDLNTLEELTIPIVKEAKASETNFKRATMKELYDFIVSEMEESCPELEDRTEHKMRVYKTTGYALLGKMYWMMGEYEKALPALKIAYERLQTDKAVYLRDFNVLEKKYGYDELSKRELFSEYSIGDYLLPVTYGNPEMLWVRQATNFMGVFRWYTGSVVYYLNPTTYDLFDEYDLRRNLIPTKNADGTPMVMPVGAIRDQTQNYGVEIPEVYLALAECEARVGDEANARKVLEEFRSYRVLTGHEGVPAEVTSRDELIRYYLDEEHREFFGRIQRVYNLRRLWNDPLFQSEKPIMHDDGTNQYTMTEDNLYIRIPDTVLDWNPGWEE